METEGNWMGDDGKTCTREAILNARRAREEAVNLVKDWKRFHNPNERMSALRTALPVLTPGMLVGDEKLEAALNDLIGQPYPATDSWNALKAHARTLVDEAADLRALDRNADGMLSDDMRRYLHWFNVNPDALSDDVKRMASGTESDDVSKRIAAYEEIGESGSLKDNRVALLIRGLHDEENLVKNAVLASIGKLNAGMDYRVYNHLSVMRSGPMDSALEKRSREVLDDVQLRLGRAYARMSNPLLSSRVRIDALETIVSSGSKVEGKTSREIVDDIIQNEPSKKLKQYAIECMLVCDAQKKWLETFLPARFQEHDMQGVRTQAAIEKLTGPGNGERKRVTT